MAPEQVELLIRNSNVLVGVALAFVLWFVCKKLYDLFNFFF